MHWTLSHGWKPWAFLCRPASSPRFLFPPFPKEGKGWGTRDSRCVDSLPSAETLGLDIPSLPGRDLLGLASRRCRSPYQVNVVTKVQSHWVLP